jgi:hypothetical protein
MKETTRGNNNGLLLLLLLLLLLAVGALVIGLVALIKHGMSIDTLNEETNTLIEQVVVLQEEAENATQQIANLTDRIDVMETLLAPTPVNGWLAFWWEDSSTGLKHSWARFNVTSGLMIGTPVPYTPSETRESSPPGKAQFSRGPAANDLAYLVFVAVINTHYLVRHNTAAGTYLRTNLGTNPTNHNSPDMVVYDPVHARYVGACTIPTQSFKYGLVVINESTGAITPLTGEFGTLPASSNQALDLEVIGPYVLLFDRWDDNSSKAHIMFYNSTDGQYVGESFIGGSLVPYPGTFLPSIHEYGPARLWYIAGGYDPATFRLHVIMAPLSASYEREFGWIEGTSEADLLTKLLSGAYDIHFTQHQSSFLLNAGVFIPS